MRRRECTIRCTHQPVNVARRQEYDSVINRRSTYGMFVPDRERRTIMNKFPRPRAFNLPLPLFQYQYASVQSGARTINENVLSRSLKRL